MSAKKELPFSDLSALLSPQSIAVVGASSNPAKVGGRVVNNLAKCKYDGELHLINPSTDEILGLPCYPKLSSIQSEIDVVVVTVPVQFIFSVLDDCEKKNVKFVIILSSGFAELGEEGRKLQEEIKDFSKRTGIRIYGPNVPGLFNLKKRMGVSLSTRFEPDQFVTGKAALVTQGGGMGRAILDANDIGLGFNYWASTGNEADLDIADFIYHFANDPDVEVIMVLIEGIKDGKKFIQACQEARKKGKPVTALKIGQTEAGKQAVMSHTGALAGEESVTNAIFQQYGIIQVDDIDELVYVAWLFSTFGTVNVKNIGIMSFSGGANGLLVDKSALYGLEVAPLSAGTMKQLEQLLPDYIECKNPIDLTALVLEQPEVFTKALEIVKNDENIDAWLIPIPYMLGSQTEKMAEETAKTAQLFDKPIIPIWTSRTHHPEQSYHILVENKIPFFRTYTEVAKMLGLYASYSKTLEKESSLNQFSHEKKSLPTRTALTEYESKALFSDFGISITKEFQTHTPEEAVKAANNIGYPVVMKVESADILHKTEAGVVEINVSSDTEVTNVFEELKIKAKNYNPSAQIQSILVQEMAEPGLELLVGLKKDPIFGPVAMLGLGGIFVEIFKDVSMRALPLSETDIEEMINSIKAKPLLDGYRGDKPRDIHALKELLRNLSKLGVTYEQEIMEIDINPVRLYEEGKGLVALDGLVLLHQQKNKELIR